MPGESRVRKVETVGLCDSHDSPAALISRAVVEPQAAEPGCNHDARKNGFLHDGSEQKPLRLGEVPSTGPLRV